MPKLTVELPESLQRDIAAVSASEGYSVDQFSASPAAEKVTALRKIESLRREAAGGNRADFERFLAAAADDEPRETDRIS